MIRNVLFGISLLALSGTSVFAAPAVKHNTKARVVAQAAEATPPAGDKAAPAAKKEKKHTTKKVKGDAAKTDGAKEMKPAPVAPEKAAK